MRLIKRIPIELLISLLIGTLATAINSAFFQNSFSFKTTLFWMVRYFSFDRNFFAWFFLFVYLLFLKKFYVKLAGMASEYILEHKKPSRGDGKELLLYFAYPFYFLAPIAIVTGPAWNLLGYLSYELRLATVDELLLQADVALTGGYPFISLPNTLQYHWVTLVLEGFYLSLAALMGSTLIMLFLLKRRFLFRQSVLAFLMSLLIGFPLFYAFPCQDPANYFLRNLRGYTFSSEVQGALTTYNPTLLTSSIIEDIAKAETDATQDNRVPISCFPSMHAVWGMFVIYFLFHLTPLSLIITIPWLFLLLTGGVYFAQHYVIDYVVALPVAAASLFLANLLLRFEAWYRSPQIKKAENFSRLRNS